jgi:hypothetical protein
MSQTPWATPRNLHKKTKDLLIRQRNNESKVAERKGGKENGRNRLLFVAQDTERRADAATRGTEER